MYSAEHSCWFIHKVIYWRAAASIAWAVLLLAPTTAAFVILSRFSPLSPFQTISECLSLLTSPGAIFSYILLCGVVMIVGFLNLQYCNVIPTVACSKIDLLGQLLHPRQVVNSFVHCIMGIIVSWCCAVTIGDRYEMLGYPCTQSDGSPQMCLNEYQFILLLAGVYVGFSHSLFGIIHNINYISFHPIQQHKYLRFKGSLLLVVKCSTTQALYSVRNYMVLYFFLGYLPRNWLCKTFDLNLNSSVHTLDTIAGLLDLSLLFHMWISAVFLLFVLYITLLLFRIFVTEGYSFPVQTSFREDAQQCLPKVLSESEPMILKFLALQDLALLSQHSPSRRCEVFSLSQPGGHPHNWNAINKECLSLLTDLTQRLVAHHDTIASNGRAKSLPMETERKTSSESSAKSGIEDGMSTRPPLQMKTPSSLFSRSIESGPHSPLSAPFTPPDLNSPFSSPGLRRLNAPLEQYSPWQGSLQSPHLMRRVPKLWSTATDSLANDSGLLSPASFTSLKEEPVKPSLVAQILQNRKDLVKNFLAKRVLIMYLFNKLPEASSEALFADSQAHIWALEGLSYLVQASFLEDQYGVVQTTLPSILSCIMILQEAVDRHFKLPHASWKPVRLSSSMGESTYKTLRFALRATLKTAIYRITTTFGEHLNAVQMSAEHRKRLQQFLEYKE